MTTNFLGRVDDISYYIAPGSLADYGQHEDHINYHYEVVKMRNGGKIGVIPISYIINDQFGAPASIKASLQQVIVSYGYDPVTLCKA